MHSMFVFPQNSCVEAPNLNMTIFADRDCEEVIKVKWGHKSGVLIWEGWCPIRRGRDTRTLSLPCEDTERRWPSASQEENYHKKLNWLSPLSWTSQPPELWDNKFLLFRPPSLWNLLWQPKQTDATAMLGNEDLNCQISQRNHC